MRRTHQSTSKEPPPPPPLCVCVCVWRAYQSTSKEIPPHPPCMCVCDEHIKAQVRTYTPSPCVCVCDERIKAQVRTYTPSPCVCVWRTYQSTSKDIHPCVCMYETNASKHKLGNTSLLLCVCVVPTTTARALPSWVRWNSRHCGEHNPLT